MKFADWAVYVLLSPYEKQMFKDELRDKKDARELAMFQRQNLAGGKICLSLFREKELENTRTMIKESNGKYYPYRGEFDEHRPIVSVRSLNLPDNALVKPEKLRVGLSSILRDDVEIMSLGFAKISIAAAKKPNCSYATADRPAREFEKVWAAQVKRGESFYCLKIEGQRITVYPESCQPKIKEYPEGFRMADRRPESETVLSVRTEGLGNCDIYTTVLRPNYEYRRGHFKLCGGVEVEKFDCFRPGIGGNGSDKSSREIDIKEYNQLKNQVVLKKLLQGKGRNN